MVQWENILFYFYSYFLSKFAKKCEYILLLMSLLGTKRCTKSSSWFIFNENLLNKDILKIWG